MLIMKLYYIVVDKNSIVAEKVDFNKLLNHFFRGIWSYKPKYIFVFMFLIIIKCKADYTLSKCGNTKLKLEKGQCVIY